VAAFIRRIMAHARARGYGGQLSRVIGRWNELEGLAKADLGIGGRQGARGARRAAIAAGGAHMSHVAAAAPAAPMPPPSAREKLAAGLRGMHADLRARFG
jgi:hypothetical protein